MLEESTHGRRTPLVVGAGILVLAAAAVVGVAAAQEPPPPIAAEPLTSRAVFPDDVDLKFKLKARRRRTMVVKVEDRPVRSSSSTRFNPARSSPGTPTPGRWS